MPYVFPPYIHCCWIFINNLNWLLSSTMIVSIRSFCEHFIKIKWWFLWIFVIDFESFNFENIFKFISYFCICAFQVICWSMVSRMKLKSFTLTKASPFDSNFGIWLMLIISHWGLWNIMYFFLIIDNLFNSSHFLFPSVHCLLFVKEILFFLGCFVLR